MVSMYQVEFIHKIQNDLFQNKNLQKNTAMKSVSCINFSSRLASTSSITSECSGDFRLRASTLFTLVASVARVTITVIIVTIINRDDEQHDGNDGVHLSGEYLRLGTRGEVVVMARPGGLTKLVTIWTS